IALIINTHPEDRRQTTDDGNPSSVLCRPSSDGTDIERPACFGSFRRRAVKQPTFATNALPCGCASDVRRLRIDRDFRAWRPSRSTLGAILPLHDVRYRALAAKPMTEFASAELFSLRTSVCSRNQNRELTSRAYNAA